MVLSTEWSQVEVIDLINDGNGLGFILVGGKSTGVVIKGLIPGGVAERDGRLQSGDHVLQIGEINLRGFCSEQVATVLRQTGSPVRIIVARPVEPTSPDYQALESHAPIIRTKLLTDPEELERQLETAAFGGVSGVIGNAFLNGTIPTTLSPNVEIIAFPDGFGLSQHNSMTLLSSYSLNIPILNHSNSTTTFCDLPETETYEVELRKNVYGLGITVAGYVCEEEDLSGIFVKSIIEGSAAEMSKKIQINDRIVAVDGKSLAGVTNHQAVDILRNTDIGVKLTLERFLRGRKYEHLQVALIDAKENRQHQQHQQQSLPPSPSIATLTWVPAKSDADSMVTEFNGDSQIEVEFESHTTVDSNVYAIENGCVDNDADDDNNSAMSNISSKHSSAAIKSTATSTASSSASSSPSPLMSGSSSEVLTPIAEPSDTVIPLQQTPPASHPPKTIQSPLSPINHIVDSTTSKWFEECPHSKIIVAEINKLAGLGISIEGTVDVEGGIEKRPHHYIRSILDDGPVAKEGTLKPGDELLQINEHRLQGLKHTDVVRIIKELPTQVKLICARGPKSPSIINTSQNIEAFESRSILPGGHLSLQGLLTKAQSESSLYTSSTATLTDQQRSKSVEQVSGLALWTNEIVYVDLEKTDRGFGFSILDYQDPLDPDGTVIVVRGLIPGGSAETTNLILPGDRLVSVAEHNLHDSSLDEAVTILKGMPLGIVRIGLCRPLSTSDNNIDSTDTTPT